MKIIIAGAGAVGFHLAKLLSSEKQDIVLIDSNQEVLDYAQSHLDVLVIKGDCSSVQTLKKAQVYDARLYIGVTTLESSNLVSCILAKKLGAKQVIARVRNQEYLEANQKKIFRELGIDKLISPTHLAGQEILRLLEASQFSDNFAFEDGLLNVVGVLLDEKSPFNDLSLKEIKDKYPAVQARAIAILRKNETILPRSQTRLKKDDHVYFIAKEDQKHVILNILNKKSKTIKEIMILGGGNIALHTALLLEEKYNIKIIESSKQKCKDLVEQLQHALVIRGNPSHIELLKEEGLEDMDAFIALTPDSEINIITSLVAQEAGVFRTIALVDNSDYTHISQNIGVDTLINKKLIAANNIFRHVRKGKIEAITSLHGVDAEIIEFIVTRESQLTRRPLKHIKFPSNAIIGGVIRNNQSLLPDGNFRLERNDKVIIFALTTCIPRLEELFG